MKLFSLFKKKDSVEDEKQKISELEKSKEELEKAHAKLKQATQDQANFISLASHQLRTPISIARGFCSMFLDGDFGGMPDRQRKYMGKINNNLEQLNRVVNEILNTARIDNNTLELHKEKTNIYKLILNVIEQLDPKVKQKELEVRVEIPIELQTTESLIDPEKMYEVVANILDNAIAYTKKGYICLKMKEDESNLIIACEDTGIGIPDEEKEKVFRRFIRTENAKAVRPDGTGIGMFLAQIVMSGHNGKIWFESQLGKGTTFYLSLPK